MASILTNTSAMVALQNLRTINSNLVDTQNQIATGKKIATATDNSAIWAVSKVIESDVSAFKAISDSLNLGDATVAVAREASETVTDILTELKGNIVASQEENVDRTKIQADIDTKVEQINSIVSAASFNGLSLVEGSDQVNILGSLVRGSDGSVSATNIGIDRQDLTTAAGQLSTSGTDLSGNITESSLTISDDAVSTANDALTFSGDFTTGAGTDISITIGNETLNFAGADLATAPADTVSAIAQAINDAGIEGITAGTGATTADLVISSTRGFEEVDVSISLSGDAAGQIEGAQTAIDTTIGERAESFTFSNAAVNEGDGFQFTFGSQTATYVAGAGEGVRDVAEGLKVAINDLQIEGLDTQVTQNDAGLWQLKIDNSATSDITAAYVARTDGSDDAVVTGGLSGLQNIDVTTDTGAAAALANIDVLINSSTDAAASFGSDQARIELQSGFISKLTDSLKAGIGSLVDADLEAASARLQALQVQQQLGIQSLSIANQAPQSILSLFR